MSFETLKEIMDNLAIPNDVQKKHGIKKISVKLLLIKGNNAIIQKIARGEDGKPYNGIGIFHCFQNKKKWMYWCPSKNDILFFLNEFLNQYNRAQLLINREKDCIKITKT